MKILIYLGHPAQFYFFKNAIKILKDNNHKVFLIIKSKDVLEKLVTKTGYEFVNILAEGRKETKSGIFWGLLKRDFRLLKFALKYKPDILLGSDPSLAHIGKIINKPVITTLEDDYSVISKLGKLTFPFTTKILTPSVCDVGKWKNKKISYNGYMKLAYLHPDYFDNGLAQGAINSSKNILIRTSKLDAHHDFGINGLYSRMINEIINRYENKYDIYISSETDVDDSLKKYSLQITPDEIHQFLSKCQLLISDSQSMSVEAAMLGVPSVRFSDFAGRISVLEELEKTYSLTFGFKTNNEKGFLEKIEQLLSVDNLKTDFQKRKVKMLKDKIDVTRFLVWFIENYPSSAHTLRINPDYQFNFK